MLLRALRLALRGFDSLSALCPFLAGLSCVPLPTLLVCSCRFLMHSGRTGAPLHAHASRIRASQHAHAARPLVCSGKKTNAAQQKRTSGVTFSEHIQNERGYGEYEIHGAILEFGKDTAHDPRHSNLNTTYSSTLGFFAENVVHVLF